MRSHPKKGQVVRQDVDFRSDCSYNKQSVANLIVSPLVDACRVVHGLHPAGADAPDVDLLLVAGEGGEAARAVGEVSHLVITRVTAEWLQSDDDNNIF